MKTMVPSILALAAILFIGACACRAPQPEPAPAAKDVQEVHTY